MDANRSGLLRNRSWMNYKNAGDRRKPEYEHGVNQFLDFAFSNVGKNEKIRCPCVSCYLGSFHDRKVVYYHLLARGIVKDYNPWTQHGEDEVEDESIPNESGILICQEENLSNPCIGNHVRDSHEEKAEEGDIRQVEKDNRNVHQGKIADRDSPLIPPNVWKYISSMGLSKTDKDGDAHKENDDNDDDGGQDVSMGEDDNFIGVNDCDSTPIQSSEDMDFVATEAEQAGAEGDSSEAAHAAKSGNRKRIARRRGSHGLKTRKEMEESKERVKVELPANVGRVVGSNARQFVVEACWLLKQTLRPDVVKWKDLDPNDVAKLLEQVKNRFIFPNESHVDTALLWQFKQWFRHWRSDLRRSYFDQDATYDEQLANCPPYVKSAHWKWLVEYWRSEKFRSISATNSRIRKSSLSIACGGSKSIARHAYELEKNQSKQDPDESPAYLKLYEQQKRRSDGTWINKEAADGYNKLVKLHKKKLENHGIDNLTPSEAFTQVFGRAKSINLVGLGENPIPFESSSKRKRKGCSDRKIIEAVRCRVEIESEKTQTDHKEAESEEENQSDEGSRMPAETSEQIREELATSSTNA